MSNLRSSYGHAALNVYDDSTNTKLTVDWSYDGLYYKYKNFNDISVDKYYCYLLFNCGMTANSLKTKNILLYGH